VGCITSMPDIGVGASTTRAEHGATRASSAEHCSRLHARTYEPWLHAHARAHFGSSPKAGWLDSGWTMSQRRRRRPLRTRRPRALREPGLRLVAGASFPRRASLTCGSGCSRCELLSPLSIWTVLHVLSLHGCGAPFWSRGGERAQWMRAPGGAYLHEEGR
jgi:hypothetical protein